MSGLEQAFYTMAIIFMSLVFLMMIAIVIVAFIIKSKINKIQQSVENKLDKLHAVLSLAGKGGELSALAGAVIAKKVRRAVTKNRS